MSGFRGQYCATGCACGEECFMSGANGEVDWDTPIHPLPESCWCFGDDAIYVWCSRMFEAEAIGAVDDATIADCLEDIRITKGVAPSCGADVMNMATMSSDDPPTFKCTPACDSTGVVDACVQDWDDCVLFEGDRVLLK